MAIDLKKIDALPIARNEPPKDGLKDFLTKDISLFAYKFSDKAKESFYLEFFTLFSAGLDIRSSLELIANERQKFKEKELIQHLLEDLISGDSFSEALKKAKHFSPYEYYSIQIGEETGQLAVVLEQLSNFYSQKIKQTRQIIGALSYPAVIFCTAMAAVFFMLNFVVPMFTDIFKRFGGELPTITKFVIGVSNWFSSYGFVMLFLILTMGVLFYIVRNKEWFVAFTSAAVLRLPIIGRLTSAIHLSTFSSSMGLLISARVPLVVAVQLVQQMTSFYPIRISLQEIERQLLEGNSLYSCMSVFSIYDRKMIALIKVGEEVNKLDFFFLKLHKRYVQDVEHNTALLGTFLEPAIIIFLGVVVAFILVAMYMPMFQMSSQMGV